jgi:hypothetical protein
VVKSRFSKLEEPNPTPQTGEFGQANVVSEPGVVPVDN